MSRRERGREGEGEGRVWERKEEEGKGGEKNLPKHH